MVLLAIASQLVIFSITGLKSVLFMIPFSLIIYLIASKKKPSGTFFVSVFVGILLFVIFLNQINFYVYPATLVLRRVLTMQGQISFYYFDFFSSHPKALLGYSIFRELSLYPYVGPPSTFIAYEYLDKKDMYMNANFFTDAFANFGLLGIIVYSMLLSGILWVYNSITKNIDIKISFALCAVFAFNIVNTSLLISLLTHGFIFTMAFLYFSPRDTLE